MKNDCWRNSQKNYTETILTEFSFSKTTTGPSFSSALSLLHNFKLLWQRYTVSLVQQYLKLKFHLIGLLLTYFFMLDRPLNFTMFSIIIWELSLEIELVKLWLKWLEMIWICNSCHFCHLLCYPKNEDLVKSPQIYF